MNETAQAPPNADATEFEAFFDRHYPRLARGLYLLTGSHHDAEDLAQETMARVYERWGRVATMSSADGYATTVALNLWRRRSRRRRDQHVESPTTPDPAATVERRDDLRQVFELLSADQREAAVVVWWLGYSAEEAAGLLGIDAASVRGRLHRARSKIRQTDGGRDG